jgi:hypothetical protein
MKEETKKIVIASDGTGRTAKRLLDAVLSQYEHEDVSYRIVKTYPSVTCREEVDKIVNEINEEYLVVYSIISVELGTYFHETLDARGILHLNVLRPMIRTLSKFLGVHPAYRPGLLQIIDDSYYRKLDAIGFTVQHDDGQGHRIHEAEVVLIGLSRTCKTPISMYLACNYGYRVANIPIVPDENLKSSLLKRVEAANPKRIMGLMIQANELVRIREERAEVLMGSKDSASQLSQYHDISLVRGELRFCRQLFAEQNWDHVDVTRRAIEEVSSEVLRELGLSTEKIREGLE